MPKAKALQHLDGFGRYDAPMKDLRFDDLMLFAQVARLRNLSAVARERDVPVSQVSRALSRIESTVGARLVHRTTHGLALSDDGQRFLAHCQAAVQAFDQLSDDFAGSADRLVGRVRVAASPVIAQFWLLPSLQALALEHPGLRVDLRVEDRFVDMAREGIDIAIRSGAAGGENLIARRIGGFGRRLYASPTYLERAGAPQAIENLADHRLIGNSAVALLNRWPFLVDSQPVEIDIDAHWMSDSTSITAELALQGLGIARMATIVGDPLVRAGRLVEVLGAFNDPRESPILALTLSRRQRPARISACIEHWARWFQATLQADPLSMSNPQPAAATSKR